VQNLDLTFEQIFYQLELREYVIIHLKETMIPYILDTSTEKLYHIPEGYLEYDAKHYYRNI
jgi:hypothetical protein